MSIETSTRHALSALPVIDIAPFLNGGSAAERQAVARELRRVCIDIGFFYLFGHGIDDAEFAAALARGRDFFRLPLAEKEKLRFNRARFGYFPLGGANEYGQGSKDLPGDLKERFSLTREAIPGEPADGNFGAGQSSWPEERVLPGFRDFFVGHIAKRAALTRALAQVFALSLDLPQGYFDAAFRHLGCVLMFNYYPQIAPVGKGPHSIEPPRWSFSPHTDYGAFTLLLQDELGGLQVRNSAGDWIDVTPLPGSFVINIGDMFAMWTNDLYKSSLHRVMNFGAAERISLALFTYPQGRTEIACLPSCMSADNPPRYQPVEAAAYNRILVEAAARAGRPGLSARTEERLRS